VRVLDTAELTKKSAILGALASFIAGSRPNDILYFHYSGHGSQVKDDADILGFDQTLVPSDYVSIKDGSNDIRDKELARTLASARDRQLTAFLLTFDSCHSGTVTRDPGPRKRGFERVFVPDYESRLERRGPFLPANALADQPFTAISACRSDESDFETEVKRVRMGSLSHALVQALAPATSETTYRDLFYQITTMMRTMGLSQTPQIEGPLDASLLGGRLLEPKRYFEIKTDADASPPAVLLEGGTLVGIGMGAEVSIYPSGDTTFRTPIATATVSAPGAFESSLNVQYAPGKHLADLAAGRARVTRMVYSEEPIRVDTSRIPMHPRAKEIAESLGELTKTGLAALAVGDAWDVQICPAAEAFGRLDHRPQAAAGGGWTIVVKNPAGAPRSMTLRGADPAARESLVLFRRADGGLLSAEAGDGTFIQSLPNDEKLADLIGETLRRETRRRLMSNLPVISSRPGWEAGQDIHVELQIVLIEGTENPVEKGTYAWKRDIRVLAPDAVGETRPRVGQLFRLQLRNRGPKPAYVTIADLGPDGTIGPLWPVPSAAIDNLIPVNERWLPLEKDAGVYAVYEFTEPIGHETFILIATENKANFAPLFDVPAIRSRGLPAAGSRGGSELNDPFGRLLANATTRDATAASTIGAKWKATAFPLDVQPR